MSKEPADLLAPRWIDVAPEPAIIAALDHAGERPEHGNQNEKRKWSERFANGCAIAIANALRNTPLKKQKTIKPMSLAAGTEPLTPLGSGASKRIDVTVVDPVLGLEVGVSLKGLNFRDQQSNNYAKNLTGRLYELGDEVRVVHEHLPHAFMVGVFFLPLDSTLDKSERAYSTFAQTVVNLRARSSRLDASLMMHAARCDAGYVALYSLGTGDVSLGAIRFFDVRNPPPRRGRPKIQNTKSLSELAIDIAARAMNTGDVTWGEAEEDPSRPDHGFQPAHSSAEADLESLLEDEIDSAASGESESDA